MIKPGEMMLFRNARAGDNRTAGGQKICFLSDWAAGTSRTLKRQDLEKTLHLCEPYQVISFDPLCTLLWSVAGTEANFSRLLDVWKRGPGCPKEMTAEDARLRLLRLCLKPEPFFLKLASMLAKKGKTLIAVSDADLPENFLAPLLRDVGYPTLRLVRTSHGGEIGPLLKNAADELNTRSVLQITGDAGAALAACSAGADAAVTIPPESMAEAFSLPETASLAMCLMHVMFARKQYAYPNEDRAEIAEQIAYTVTGPLTVGYCRFLRDQQALRHWKRLFFASRDGWLMHQVYNRYFGWSEYLPLSRAATQCMTIRDDPAGFVKNNLLDRVPLKVPLGEVLEDIGLGQLPEQWAKDGLTPETLLTRPVLETVTRLLERDRDQAEACFQDAMDNAESWFSNLFRGDTDIVVADTGWKASSPVALETFLNRRGHPVRLTSVLMGTLDTPEVQRMVDSGQLITWLYSPTDHATVRKRQIRPGNLMACSLMEFLYTTDQAPLVSYAPDQGGFTYGEKDPAAAKIAAAFEKGVMAFAADWFGLMKELSLTDLPCGPEELYSLFDRWTGDRETVLAVLGDLDGSLTPTPDSRSGKLAERLISSGFFDQPAQQTLRRVWHAAETRLTPDALLYQLRQKTRRTDTEDQ